MEDAVAPEKHLKGECFERFCQQHGVELAVLFGSQSTGRSRPESDWDVAFWLDSAAPDASGLGRRQRAMVRDLCSLLQTSRIDVVLLNRASPLLRYQVALSGKPIFQSKHDRFASFVSLALRSYSDGWSFKRAGRRYLEEGRMVHREVLQRKLAKLKGYLRELETLSELSWENYRNNSHYRRAVERLIQLIVDVAIDINTHSVVDEGKPPPRDSYNSFLTGADVGLFSREFAERIAPSTGERNIIVHEYESIDDSLVYHSIADFLLMYSEYICHLKRHL